MSNELQIENIERDNMDGELHSDSRGHTEKREGTYQNRRGCTLKLCIIFMVCRCEKKSKNPLFIFDQDQLLIMGECVDPHLPNKDCYYQQFPQADYTFKFKCICNCRPSLSYPGRA